MLPTLRPRRRTATQTAAVLARVLRAAVAPSDAASQYVVAETAKGPVVLASDNVYLYLNLDSRAPIAQTLDGAANLKAQDRMRALSGKSQIIVPGHDPEVFTRFRTVAEGVVEIAGGR